MTTAFRRTRLRTRLGTRLQDAPGDAPEGAPGDAPAGRNLEEDSVLRLSRYDSLLNGRP